MDKYSKIRTKIGEFWLACNRYGVTMVYPATISAAQFEDLYQREVKVQARSGRVPAEYIRALRCAATGRAFSHVPMDLSRLTTFQRRVLENIRRIPRGQVRTYSWLAHQSGKPKAFRAAGNAVARNPVPILIPCHRVVPASGGIGNYGLGCALKRELLISEGVPADKL